jgi:hypothetical protein
MGTTRAIRGKAIQGETPNWDPLMAVVGHG